jgi:hypothetical protein
MNSGRPRAYSYPQLVQLRTGQSGSDLGVSASQLSSFRKNGVLHTHPLSATHGVWNTSEGYSTRNLTGADSSPLRASCDVSSMFT